MNEYVSKKRRTTERELLMYLRRYRFFCSRFKSKDVLDKLIDDIVNELKGDF